MVTENDAAQILFSKFCRMLGPFCPQPQSCEADDQNRKQQPDCCPLLKANYTIKKTPAS
ncbi:hypothetical protein BDV98DRAFT_577629 [Pterulicium gracile]|uniref:Uncharacterized protein n=1 Tax=Pterulicium gracile TaxID=1884261 RepID=A0A5C3Q5L6_9AGAR|nr:hypothetical protein BDV98DRAFT_577629 [Pterula gracilis]